MIPWRGPSICLAGATCYLTQPSLFPTAACSIRPCPGQEWIKSTCQPGPAEGQPPVWWPPLLGRVGWVCRNLVPCRWEQFRLLNVSSGISGKRPFLAKSWPDAARSSPKAVGSSQEPRGAARSSQARSSQDQPDAARSSQEQPEEARSSQQKPGAARSSQKQPKAARSTLPQEGGQDAPAKGQGYPGKNGRIPRQKFPGLGSVPL